MQQSHLGRSARSTSLPPLACCAAPEDALDRGDALRSACGHGARMRMRFRAAPRCARTTSE